jgi:hypothetical protein
VIKAAGTTGFGAPLLFLGLSGENITRLAAGDPIRVTVPQMQQLGLPPMEVIIHYGRTEQDILDQLQSRGVQVHDAAREQSPQT